MALQQTTKRGGSHGEQIPLATRPRPTDVVVRPGSRPGRGKIHCQFLAEQSIQQSAQQADSRPEA